MRFKKPWKTRDTPDTVYSKLGDTPDSRRNRADNIENEISNNRKWIIGMLVTVPTLLISLSMLLKKDVYIGFYYPDKSNLTNNIQSKATFDSLDVCRDWVNDQVIINNPDNSNYDYECGKNCKLQNGQKPYICEETLK